MQVMTALGSQAAGTSARSLGRRVMAWLVLPESPFHASVLLESAPDTTIVAEVQGYRMHAH